MAEQLVRKTFQLKYYHLEGFNCAQNMFHCKIEQIYYNFVLDNIGYS